MHVDTRSVLRFPITYRSVQPLQQAVSTGLEARRRPRTACVHVAAQ